MLCKAAARLIDAYCDYVISGLTQENIKYTTIKFGEHLELSNGKIIHKLYDEEIPLDTILGIEEEDGTFILKGKYTSFPIEDPLLMMNGDILDYIVNGMNPESHL